MKAPSHGVRKAVLPAAGLGTRFLPATKAMPKEMLPIVDKPLIQYGVEEIVESGIHEICIVTGRGKAAIENHFDVSFELESILEKHHKHDLLQKIQSISEMIEVSYVRQREALGLGHAILRARSQVGADPFAVLLSDDIIDSRVPCTLQLLNVFQRVRAPVLALMEVPDDATSSYGIVKARRVDDGIHSGLFRIDDLVEKPAPGEAPSNLAVIGRYVLTPDIFPALEGLSPGHGGEIQLTDALKTVARNGELYGVLFDGRRFDAGDKLGFLIANVEYALQSEDLGRPFLAYLRTLLAHHE